MGNYNDSFYLDYLDVLELSVKSYNILRRAGIETVCELLELSDDKLIGMRNMGKRSYFEIKEALYEYVMRQRGETTSTVDFRNELKELIGLDEVKEQVARIEAFARLKKDMSPEMQKKSAMSLNMAFVGNPGTAKTTVARLLAGILREIGILTCSEIVEVGRGDLVGQYAGHTAEKVKEVFSKAKGKLLFIDEAYSLCEYWKGGYGDEAINTIVQEMENNRADTVVVFAGYPDKMADFFDRNPGLKSRVPFMVSFGDYSADEMLKIALYEASRKGFMVDEDAKPAIYELCKGASLDSENGNGRFCRNLVESAILDYAVRTYADSDNPGVNDYILRSVDIKAPANAVSCESAKPVIGFV